MLADQLLATAGSGGDSTLMNWSLSYLVYCFLLLITSLAVLVIYAIITVDLIVLKIGIWFLAYVGVFILAFGGINYTKEMAIGFYKTVIAQALQMMILIAIAAVGSNMIRAFIKENLLFKADKSVTEITSLLMVLASLAILHLLAKDIPTLISNIIAQGQLKTGASIMGAGAMAAGSLGASAASDLKAIGNADIAKGAKDLKQGVLSGMEKTAQKLQSIGNKIGDKFSGSNKSDQNKSKKQASPLADQHK